jgi:hypothetical protein
MPDILNLILNGESETRECFDWNCTGEKISHKDTQRGTKKKNFLLNTNSCTFV